MRANRTSATTIASVLAVTRVPAAGLAIALAAAFSACGGPPTAPAGNAAPTVTVAFETASSCMPQPGTPCTLTVLAQASDPDGDPIRYAWSGCANGTSARAVCTVERAGPVVASVEVSDNHGHTVTRTLNGEGAAVPNASPTVAVLFDGASTCFPQPGRPCTLDVRAEASDPDGDPVQYAWSGCATGTAARAVCTVDRSGPVTARVEVSDDHGHTVSGTITGEGTATPNAAPIVTVVVEGASACEPQPGKPCTIQVVAQASDPDGDPLRYAWSGCATGTAARATCQLDRPGASRASVEVSDDHGHSVSGSVAVFGDGINRPPGVQIGYIIAYPSGSFDLLGSVVDPDEGPICGRQYLRIRDRFRGVPFREARVHMPRRTRGLRDGYCPYRDVHGDVRRQGLLGRARHRVDYLRRRQPASAGRQDAADAGATVRPPGPDDCVPGRIRPARGFRLQPEVRDASGTRLPAKAGSHKVALTVFSRGKPASPTPSCSGRCRSTRHLVWSGSRTKASFKTAMVRLKPDATIGFETR